MKNQRSYLPNLDLLRVVAAYFVLLFHFRWEGDDSLTYICSFGYLGVYVFFAISGFITPLAMEWSDYSLSKWRKFLISRFFRLYPAFAFIAVIQIGLYALNGSSRFEEMTFLQLVANFTWTAELLGEDWLVAVFWTLAIEAQFTFLILFVYPLLHHKREWARALVVLILIGLNYLLGRGDTIFNYSAIFSMGILAYLYYIKKLRLVLFLPLLITAYFAYEKSVSSWHANTAIVTIVFAAFMPQLYARWVQYLGKFAYSFFLTHITFGGIALFHLRFLPDEWYFQAVRVFLASLAAFAASWIFYLKLERPFHDYSRRFKS